MVKTIVVGSSSGRDMHEVEMAGYWPSSFLCCYGPRRIRDPQKRKKE